MDGIADFMSDEARWAAVAGRDGRADGVFWFGVVTTGIYCLPSCPARRPKPGNVRFFDAAEDAVRAGYRPCRRCRPDDPPGRRIADICRWVERQEEMPDLAAMAAEAGMSPSHFHRTFRRALGLTPKQFTDAVRHRRLEAGLDSAATVTDAIYGAGYAGAGGFYRTAGARLGMAPARRRRGGEGLLIRRAVASSSLGMVLVAATARGVCAILLGDDAEGLDRDLARRFPRAVIEPAAPGSEFDDWVRAAVALVDRPGGGISLPLDVVGTAFQERVWRALQSIPPGATASYADIAAAIGRPGAARAVAGACAANPAAVAIPCHRAVRSDGGIAGYRWGTARKKALLEKEAKAG